MEIQLSSTKDIVIVKERKRSIDKISVLEITDYPNDKKVVARTLELGFVTLWKDSEYDLIGQWTDADVVNRFMELYNS